MDGVNPVGQEFLPLDEALGRALAEPISARVDHPLWDNSAMDGFAVHRTDVEGASRSNPVVLPVVDDIPAGSFPRGPLHRGTAAKIMTGAPVPEGATGIIRVEHTDGGDGGRVSIFRDDDACRHIRLRGEDFQSGDILLEAGEQVGPAAVALAATAGREQVKVGRRPRVGVLATGSELVEPADYDEVLAGRRIVNSNGPAIASQLREAGAEPVPLGVAADDPAEILRRIEAGKSCDAIVSSAGVSVGEHDYVKEVLDSLGFMRRFWRLELRPGSAVLFGHLDGCPFWGVPGNPVSALVTVETLVRPAIRRMAGFARAHRTPVRCIAGESLRGALNPTVFLRVLLEGESARRSGSSPTVRLSGPQGSGILTSMLADGLAELPAGVSVIEQGSPVMVTPVREWAGS